MIKAQKTRSDIDICNTIEYNMKSYQAKTPIVKCTKLRIKVLKFNCSKINFLYGQPVCNAIKQTHIRSKLKSASGILRR